MKTFSVVILFTVFAMAHSTATAIEISDLRTSNITSSSVTISWVTDEPSGAQINYGPTLEYGSMVTDKEVDVHTHWLRITGLSPKTQYHFEAISGDAKSNGEFRTAPIVFGDTYTVHSKVHKPDGIPAEGAIVYLKAKHPANSDFSTLVSILTSSDGSWVFDLGNLREQPSLQPFSWAVGDEMVVQINGGPNENAEGTYTVNGDSPQSLDSLSLTKSAEVVFLDPNLEATIREALNKPEGPITDKDLAGLTELEAVLRDIMNLTGIEHCVNLQTLNLQENQIIDISPLSMLNNLQTLNLFANQITDISLLSELTNLQLLDLGVNQLTNISPLNRLANLIDLSLGNNRIIDISPLSILTNLQKLDLPGNQLTDISSLSGLINLQSLNLSGNQLTDISPLSGLINLQWLFLQDDQIIDISSLSGLNNLQSLSLSDNQITNLSPLSGLNNLQRLFLFDNQITDISSLNGLTNLQMLRLSDNQIIDISPLSKLTDMRLLFLDHNQITDISPLAGMAKLGEHESVWADTRDDISIYLGLSGNRISDISPLVSNTGLGEGDGIDLSDNPLNSKSYDTYIPQLQARGVNVLFDEASYGILTGTVVDADTGEPIERVVIKVNGNPVQTDREGNFELSLPSDKYNVTASAKGYLIESKEVEVNPDETKELSLSALPALEIWPGDTDNDGKISILDILPIGRFWGKEGDKREPQEIKWQIGLTPIRNWNPKEAAFADADGNGIVDENDVLVIPQNWRAERSEVAAAPESGNVMKLLADRNLLDKYRKMYQVLGEMKDSKGAIVLREFLGKMIIESKPKGSMLLANYPNPFNPETWIPFVLAEGNEVEIRIYDIIGREVKKLEVGYRNAGYYLDKRRAVKWDGRNEQGELVASGVYIIELRSAKGRTIRKIVMAK